MASNRDHVLNCLSGIDDDSERSMALLAEAQVLALLDIADAIREGHPDDDDPVPTVIEDYVVNRLEEALAVIGDPLRELAEAAERIRTEVADLRCAVNR